MTKHLRLIQLLVIPIIFLLISSSTNSYAQNFNSNIRYFNATGYGLDKIGQTVSMNELTYKQALEGTKIYHKYKDSVNDITYQIKDDILIGFMVTTLSKASAENAIRNITKDHGNPTAEDDSSMIWNTTKAICLFIKHENKYIFSISKN